MAFTDPIETFNALPERVRIFRMRELARAALQSYGLGKVSFRLVRYAGNTLFRVIEPTPRRTTDDVFIPGHSLLRIHHPSYKPPDAIALELEWLAAIRRDARAPVPEPVRTKQGRLIATVRAPDVPGERTCSLLRWVNGRHRTKDAGPRHFRAQGRLMALLHEHAARWRPPAGLSRRHYDWNGLFREHSGAGIPAREAWALLPKASQGPFESVAERVRQLMNAWGRGPDVYGPIHADLGIDANVLFHRGEARAIDFDESGFGYWVFDLAVSLEHCREDPKFPRYRDSLLSGYEERRHLSEEHLAHIPLFMAAFDVYWSLWATAYTHRHPGARKQLGKRISRTARLVKRYLARH